MKCARELSSEATALFLLLVLLRFEIFPKFYLQTEVRPGHVDLNNVAVDDG
jgi:hypothetical protein